MLIQIDSNELTDILRKVGILNDSQEVISISRNSGTPPKLKVRTD